jgi:hypothetical protein
MLHSFIESFWRVIYSLSKGKDRFTKRITLCADWKPNVSAPKIIFFFRFCAKRMKKTIISYNYTLQLIIINGENELIMELSMKWAGNPNIIVAVKAFGLRATKNSTFELASQHIKCHCRYQVSCTYGTTLPCH